MQEDKQFMETTKEIVLTEEQREILKKMELSNDNMFITGYPGTGKSELLRQFVKSTKKKVVVLAPTGKAALNIGGQTIHSFFKLNPNINTVNDLGLGNIDYVRDIIKRIDTIIIDEVSMVPPNLVDIIDTICRTADNSFSTFGGKQLIFFGDLFQLLPVISDDTVKSYLKKEYGGIMFYRAHAFEDNNLKTYELTKVFRQKDEKFKHILNDVRTGKVSKEELDILNARVINSKKDIITLTTRNDIADKINKSKLAELQGKEYVFKAEIEGNISYKQCPCDDELRLKVGAQIIMLVNDIKGGKWVNGTTGTITSLKSNEIKVMISGIEYTLDKHLWSNYRYVVKNGRLEKETIGTFIQYPIRLAWAITIHKAQGQTYKSVLIDIGTGSFAEGQTYVALSRCVSLDTLYLNRPITYSDIMVNQEAIDFMQHNTILKLGGNENE